MTKRIPRIKDQIVGGESIHNSPESFAWLNSDDMRWMISDGHFEVHDYMREIDWRGQKQNFTTFELTLCDNYKKPPVLYAGPRTMSTTDSDILLEWMEGEDLDWEAAKLAWPLLRIITMSDEEVVDLFSIWKESTQAKLKSAQKTLRKVIKVYDEAPTPLPGPRGITEGLINFYEAKINEVTALRKSKLKLLASGANSFIVKMKSRKLSDSKIEKMLDSLFIVLNPDTVDTRARNVLKTHRKLYPL